MAKNKSFTIGFLILIIVFLLIFIINYNFIHQYIFQTQKIQEIREDIIVNIDQEVVDKLNSDYILLDREYYYCLVGENKGSDIFITEAYEPDFVDATDEMILLNNDFPCHMENSIGSIHSHLRKFKRTQNDVCLPSYNDVFIWGTMENPRPVINGLQCDKDLFIFFITDLDGNRVYFKERLKVILE